MRPAELGGDCQRIGYRFALANMNQGADLWRWLACIGLGDMRIQCVAPCDCFAMKASTSAACQTVMDLPNLNGFGNLPSRTQRHTVAGLTGSLPGLFGVLANWLIRMTSCDTSYPSIVRRNAIGVLSWKTALQYSRVAGIAVAVPARCIVCRQRLCYAGRLLLFFHSLIQLHAVP